jgi:hypothetical protein
VLIRCGGSGEPIFNGVGALYQAVAGEEGAGPKKKIEIKLARLDLMCTIAHGPDDDPRGWWDAVGDGSSGGYARSDAGGGFVLVLT